MSYFAVTGHAFAFILKGCVGSTWDLFKEEPVYGVTTGSYHNHCLLSVFPSQHVLVPKSSHVSLSLAEDVPCLWLCQ